MSGASAISAIASAAGAAAKDVGPQWFKRSQRGLYAGKMRLTGNHVSPSKRHVRRVWLPNVQRKNLWSAILNRHISINVTTHALKQIDRVGGVDNYLLGTPDDQLQSEVGVRLRKILQRTLREQATAADTSSSAASAGSEAATSAPLR